MLPYEVKPFMKAFDGLNGHLNLLLDGDESPPPIVEQKKSSDSYDI